MRPPTTGVFIEAPEAHFAGRCDPVTLEEWDSRALHSPVVLHNNTSHFYQLTPDVLQMRSNPLTRAPLQRTDAFEPILHRNTGIADYVDMLRALGCERGWNYRDIILSDMYALARSLRARPYADQDEALVGTHLLRWPGQEPAFVNRLCELASLPPPAPPGTAQHPPRR